MFWFDFFFLQAGNGEAERASLVLGQWLIVHCKIILGAILHVVVTSKKNIKKMRNQQHLREPWMVKGDSTIDRPHHMLCAA
jgi:hypothetical protein